MKEINKLLKSDNSNLIIAKKIDELIASKDIKKLFKIADLLKNKGGKDIFLYYLGNIYQTLFSLTIKKEEYLKLAIDYFSKFIYKTNKNEIYKQNQIPALINLGNLYFDTNRIFDALECYIKAEKLNEKFLLSKALKIRVLFFLQDYYSDFNKALSESIFLYIMEIFRHLESLYGKNLIDFVLNENDFESKNAKNIISEYMIYLKDLYKIDTFNDFISKKTTNKKNKYYDWCFENNFILNILGTNEFNNYFYYDFVDLHKIIGDFEKPQFIFDLLNNIIQEFTSARYLFYKHKNIKTKIENYTLNIRRNIADKDVQLLSEVKDGTLFSYEIEMLKTTFLKLFNILDKIKLCLIVYIKINNEILNTEHLTKDKKNSSLDNNFLKDNKNILDKKHFLYTLYNIILEKENTDKEGINKKIDIESNIGLFIKIRNKLTHGLLKICIDDYFIDSSDFFEKSYDLIEEIKHNYYKITFDNFLYSLMELLKYIKNLIFYLSFAINDFEKYKENEFKKSNELLDIIKLDKYQF